jgi:hypothetical protein
LQESPCAACILKKAAQNQQVSLAEIRYPVGVKSCKGSSIDFLIYMPPNFDDQLVLRFLGSFRKARIAAALVSPTPGLIKSAQGLRVQADFSIDQWPETTRPRFVLVLENRQAISALLANPRVQHLLDRTLAAQGRLVILPETESLFQAAGFSEVMIVPESVKTKPYILREFVSQLMSLMTE